MKNHSKPELVAKYEDVTDHTSFSRGRYWLEIRAHTTLPITYEIRGYFDTVEIIGHYVTDKAQAYAKVVSGVNHWNEGKPYLEYHMYWDVDAELNRIIEHQGAQNE